MSSSKLKIIWGQLPYRYRSISLIDRVTKSQIAILLSLRTLITNSASKIDLKMHSSDGRFSTVSTWKLAMGWSSFAHSSGQNSKVSIWKKEMYLNQKCCRFFKLKIFLNKFWLRDFPKLCHLFAANPLIFLIINL